LIGKSTYSLSSFKPALLLEDRGEGRKEGEDFGRRREMARSRRDEKLGRVEN